MRWSRLREADVYEPSHAADLHQPNLPDIARTVQLKKDEGNKDPEALSGMLEAIDQGSDRFGLCHGG